MAEVGRGLKVSQGAIEVRAIRAWIIFEISGPASEKRFCVIEYVRNLSAQQLVLKFMNLSALRSLAPYQLTGVWFEGMPV